MDSDDKLIELEPPDGYEYELDPVGEQFGPKQINLKFWQSANPTSRPTSGRRTIFGQISKDAKSNSEGGSWRSVLVSGASYFQNMRKID